MQRVATFALDDIAVDCEAVALALTESCSARPEHYHVSTLLQLQDTVYFLLQPAPEARAAAASYFFVPVSDFSSQGVTSMLFERWSAGFTAVGSVTLDDGLCLLLLSRPAE
jgi:hypothetical protein